MLSRTKRAHLQSDAADSRRLHGENVIIGVYLKKRERKNYFGLSIKNVRFNSLHYLIFLCNNLLNLLADTE